MQSCFFIGGIKSQRTFRQHMFSFSSDYISLIFTLQPALPCYWLAQLRFMLQKI